MYESIESANGLRRAQVGNLRKEYGYDQVTVDVQLQDDLGTPFPVLSCFIIQHDDRLRSSVLGGCTSRYAPTYNDWVEMRQHVDRFIAKHDEAIRALEPRISSSPV